MGRVPADFKQTAFRLPEELLERLDRAAEKKSSEGVGPRWGRSDIVRYLLNKGLEEMGFPMEEKDE